MSLLTLDEAKLYLRYEHNADDAEIQSLVDAAETVIKEYVDDNRYNEANASLKRAAKLLIGYWDENRSAEADGNWYLPSAVLAILTPYRTPVAV